MVVLSFFTDKYNDTVNVDGNSFMYCQHIMVCLLLKAKLPINFLVKAGKYSHAPYWIRTNFYTI